MLIQFTFKNFKSFRDETTLDLSATKITEHSGRVVAVGQEKLLTVAAVFGANASGKSNVIRALRFMRSYVVDSFAYGGEDEVHRSLKKVIQPRRSTLLFDKLSTNANCTFVVYFTTNDENAFRSYSQVPPAKPVACSREPLKAV